MSVSMKFVLGTFYNLKVGTSRKVAGKLFIVLV